MRKNHRSEYHAARRGFTLVELMMVVAIVGVLAALAVFGVRRFLGSAKSAEAKEAVGAITRGAVLAYERDASVGQIIATGQHSVAGGTHALCTSATAVPTTVPKGVKYQPKTGQSSDYETGSATAGWRCLRFSLNTPTYYRFGYAQGSGYVATANPAYPSATGFEASAQGDTDGNGAFATFARTGNVNTTSNQVIVATQVYIDNETE